MVAFDIGTESAGHSRIQSLPCRGQRRREVGDTEDEASHAVVASSYLLRFKTAATMTRS